MLSSFEHLLVDMNRTEALLDSLTTHHCTLELVSSKFTNACLSTVLAQRSDMNHKMLLRVDVAVGW
jgi:hypothetical protein